MAICSSACSPNRPWKPSMPSGRNAHDSVSRVHLLVLQGLDGEAPPHPAVVDHPCELATGIGGNDPAARLPRALSVVVASGEVRADGRAAALVPPAGPALRAPLAHPGDVGHQRVQVVGVGVHHDGVTEFEIAHVRTNSCSGSTVGSGMAGRNRAGSHFGGASGACSNTPPDGSSTRPPSRTTSSSGR